MKQTLIDELAQYFPNLNQYDDEIKAMEDTLVALGCESSMLDNVLFWNHYLALMKRVYDGELSDLEFENNGDIAQSSLDMAKKVVENHSILKHHALNDFEIYLLAIYFQKGKVD